VPITAPAAVSASSDDDDDDDEEGEAENVGRDAMMSSPALRWRA